MHKLILGSILIFSTVIFLAACSGSVSPTNSISSKPVNIEVESNPNPAVTGDVTYTLTITDKNGNPIEGAQVDVTVDHTDMAGMGMSGPATEQGNGKYAIHANFSMSGKWRMTVYVRKDSLDYKEEIDLMVK